MGTKFDAATVDEELVRAYREKQKAKTEKILDEYLRICLQKGVCTKLYTYTYICDMKFPPFLRRLVLQIQAEKMCVEMDSIEKGIVQMISENRVRKFIMGAAADKQYSTYCVSRLHACVSASPVSFFPVSNLTLVVINLQENGGFEIEKSHLRLPTRISDLSYTVYLQRTSHPYKVQARVLFFIAVYKHADYAL